MRVPEEPVSEELAAEGKEIVDHEDSLSAGEAATGAGITAAVVVMFLFLRLLAVSGWNWKVAADIADSFDFDDAIPIVFGTLFELPLATGIASSVILPLAIYRLYLMRVDNDRKWKVSDWFVIILLAVVLYVLWSTYDMWWTVSIAVILTVLLGLFAKYVKKGPFHDTVVALARRTGTMLIVGILVLAVVVSTPWNVKERIVTSHGVIEGHVLETTPGFVKVLTDDREVVIFLTSDIKSRESMAVNE